MLKRLNVQKFSLVACSYATAIALEYAKKHQYSLNKIVLAGSMKDIPLSEWPTMLQLMRDCAFDTPQFANGFIDLLTEKEGLVARQDVIRKAAVRKAAKYRSENFWHFVFNTIRLMCYEPGNLNGIHVPCLVFTGEYDPYVKPEHSEQLASSMGNAEFSLVRGCDHLFHIENPKDTISLILSFLSSEESTIAA
jgi:pimeloyl-ACP methyl ester carboxylesterase